MNILKFLLVFIMSVFPMLLLADKKYSEKRYADHTRHMDNRMKQGDSHMKAGNYGQAARNYVSAAGHAINKAKHDVKRK